ncbi:MAG TPA: TRAP transporter small permease subunit [Geminicoccaceae bacterium]|nr:TRAP transporter small permease subunit [Geminicoccaceae bacterium]
MANDSTVQSAQRSEMPTAIRISDGLRAFVDFVGKWACWLILPLIIVTVFDVTARKMVWIQIWLVENLGRIFESTLLQELEWHFHTALFALVLGYGYIYNTHVRVDLVREHLSFRNKAWLELIGLTFFLIPYCAIVIYFAYIYAYDSWAISEISASQVGLTHRWIIKSVLVFGLVVAVLSGVAVWLQVAIVLWGPKDVRFPLMTLEWPDEDMKIEGKERIKLEELEQATWDAETETLRKGSSPVGTAD